MAYCILFHVFNTFPPVSFLITHNSIYGQPLTSKILCICSSGLNGLLPTSGEKSMSIAPLL